MRTDILDLHHFYESRLGVIARDIISDHLNNLWADVNGLRVAGFGFTTPWLGQFDNARTLMSLAPDAQGVMRWPQAHSGAMEPENHTNRACLVHEGFWPLPDRSIDRVLIAHGLEEVRDASRLLREVWRILADDGKVIIIAAQRRGFWASFDTTPLAAGRPWLRGQLGRLLERSLFTPLHWHRALHFPPSKASLILKSAPGWEKVGRLLWPGFCGVLIVEADKSMMHPAKGTPHHVLNVIRPRLSGQLFPKPVGPVGPVSAASIHAANNKPRQTND